MPVSGNMGDGSWIDAVVRLWVNRRGLLHLDCDRNGGFCVIRLFLSDKQHGE